jgi:hypothetical protein
VKRQDTQQNEFLAMQHLATLQTIPDYQTGSPSGKKCSDTAAKISDKRIIKRTGILHHASTCCYCGIEMDTIIALPADDADA